MARRQAISVSVAATTRDLLYRLVAEVQAETTIEIRPGIILDVALPLVPTSAILQAMGLHPRRTPEPPDASR